MVINLVPLRGGSGRLVSVPVRGEQKAAAGEGEEEEGRERLPARPNASN